LHTVDSTNYIDKVEWLVSDVVQAIYNTNITTGSSTTISSPTSGDFANVNSDFTIKIYFVGDKSSTPIIQEVYGSFTATSAEPSIPDFNIQTTSEFDSGTKTNTTTTTDRFNQTADSMELDFPTASKDASLISYWRFEGDATDKLGTNDGTLQGPTFNSSGKFDGAYSYDGSNDYIDLGSNLPDTTISSYAISMWFRPAENIDNSDTGDFKSLLIRNDGVGAGFEYTLGIDKGVTATPGKLIFTSGQGLIRLVSTTDSWTGDQWYHVLVNNSNGNCQLYIDGVSQDTATNCDSLLDRAPITTFGRYGDVAIRFWNGTIDEAKFYNRSLTTGELKDLYNDGNKHKFEGFWVSDTMPLNSSKQLANMTISHIVYGETYIDKVEWLVNDVVKATYDTNITSAGSTTITSPTSGSFASVNGDFTIKVYLVGNKTDTPAITQIQGFYKQAAQSPFITAKEITPLFANGQSSLGCSFTIEDASVGDTLAANVTWYKNGLLKTEFTANEVSCTNGTTCSTTSAPNFLDVESADNFTCNIIAYDTEENSEEANATKTILKDLIVVYTDQTADSFDFTPPQWNLTLGDIESTFAGACPASIGTAYTFYQNFTINSSKIIDQIIFVDEDNSTRYEVSAITLNKV